MTINYNNFISTLNGCLRNFQPILDIPVSPDSIFTKKRLYATKMVGGSGSTASEELEHCKRYFSSIEDEIKSFVLEHKIHPEDYSNKQKKQF